MYKFAVLNVTTKVGRLLTITKIRMWTAHIGWDLGDSLLCKKFGDFLQFRDDIP